MKLKITLLLVLVFAFTTSSFSQGSPDYNGGLKVKFNDDGSKYFRVISWIQGQGIYTMDVPEDQSNFNFQVRRARVLLYSQITDKFLILTHFGLNSLNSNTMSPVGKGDGTQLFLHDAWIQYSVAKKHVVGMGLHYFNGISRLNNQSTLNMLTLDNNRQSWSTLGLSDQFARHLGVFAKGSFGKLQYRVAINDAITNGLDMRDPTDIQYSGEAIYGGKRVLGSKTAGFAYAGYFEYNLFDQESNFLPFKVGSYLGAKRIFNIGAGFFYHPNGSVIAEGTDLVGQDVSMFAVDAFYEAPLSDRGDAITAYATFQTNDYGTNYLYNVYGTGSMVYGHVGYLFGGDKAKPRIQPYASYAVNSYDATSDTRNVFGVGANLYLSGHNSKLTLEYKSDDFGTTNKSSITLQAMIYL
jgi:hypothetical protein